MTLKISLPIAIIFTVLSAACTFKTSVNSVPGNGNANQTANTTAEPTGTPSSGGGESAAIAAASVVADLYKQHDAKKSPFFQTKDRGLVDKFFTKRLGDLIWKDANESAGEVGAIDADPLYNAQDTEIKNFAVGAASVNGDSRNSAGYVHKLRHKTNRDLHAKANRNRVEG